MEAAVESRVRLPAFPLAAALSLALVERPALTALATV